jgi:putative transposase
MENYRRSSHTVYDLKYHLVWITKYRKPVLAGEVARMLRELVREICKGNDVEIIKGHISRDHIHIFVSVPPHISVSDLLKSIKGKTSRKLLMEFKTLSRQFWGRHLWARGYFAASSGNVTDEVIMKYIEQQGHKPPDADFKIDGDDL